MKIKQKKSMFNGFYVIRTMLTVLDKSLLGCLYGGGPALLVGLALERGLDFTSRLYGKSQPSYPG